MELVITNTLKSLILPPGCLLLPMLLGMVLLRSRPLLARLLLWFGLIAIYLLSTGAVAFRLANALQVYPALKPEEVVARVREAGAGAIVVLSADRYAEAPEYGFDTVGGDTLERLRYGVFLHRQTGLPLLVSGGFVLDTKGDSLAAVMVRTLHDDYGIDKVWVEDRSSTTGENAIYSQQLLQEKGIDTVLLVTHSNHMARAVKVFEQSGLKVIPAPTVVVSKRESGVPGFMELLPNAWALEISSTVLYEWAGQLWYRLRYSAGR